MTPTIPARQQIITHLTLALIVLGLTVTLAVAQQPVAPRQPAPATPPAPAAAPLAIPPPQAPPAPVAAPKAAAQPAPPGKPAPAATPTRRPLPSRGVKLEVTLTPVAGAVAGSPRVLTVTTAEGRYAKFRRQGPDHFSLDAMSTIVNDRQVLVEFNLNANASERSAAKETAGIVPPGIAQVSAGIGQEGSVLLTPGVRQRITQLDDSGDRPSFHLEMLVEIVK